MARLACNLTLPLDRFTLEATLETDADAVGVFGASGSGKTSLLETVAGLRRGARGRLSFAGTVWLDSATGVLEPPEGRRVGYVPQDGLLFPNLDVKGNLLAGAGRAKDASSLLERVSDVLRLAPLWPRDVRTLSGGERQRVALGRALCSGPDLLLLDEPLASLDLALRRRLIPFLRQVRKEFAVPLLLVSHDPMEVQALCDELVVLDDGRIVARGAPSAVLRDPNVSPLAERGFENTLACRVVSSQPGGTLVSVGSDVTLSAQPAAVAVGDTTLVVLPARDVLLALGEPTGLSARNVLPARVTDVTRAGERRLVTVAVGEAGVSMVAELSSSACADLDVREGLGLHVLVKSSSITVLPTS